MVMDESSCRVKWQTMFNAKATMKTGLIFEKDLMQS